MQTPTSSNKRWIHAVWLVLSQLGSFILLLAPYITALAASALMMAGGAMFIVYVCLFPIIPVVLIITAWILFVRRKEMAASIVSGILLLLSIAAFAALEYMIGSMS